MSVIGDISTQRGSGAPGLPRYSRVKGEAEAAVLDSGSGVVSIFGQRLIFGSRHIAALVGLRLWSIFTPLMAAKYRFHPHHRDRPGVVAAARRRRR